MAKGISVFLGMDYTLEENIKLIKTAKKNGFTKIFTSLHIPEADYDTIIKEFKTIVNLANDIGMKITADISPIGLKLLGLNSMDLKALKEMGISVIRLDFGFSDEETALFINNDVGMKIEVNASTITKEMVEKFESLKVNFNNLLACHNYYPRKHTGIDEALIIEKNNMLKEKGVELSAFVPSLEGKRGPLYEGLPTLEEHRNKEPYIATKHLFALGNHNVFFGDAMPSIEELKSLKGIDNDKIELRVVKSVDTEIVDRYLNKEFYRNRIDCPKAIIRGEDSGKILNGDILESNNTIKREVGDVTLDNKGYLRYMGELQIVKEPLEKDPRVNIIAKIVEEDRFLLRYIKSGSRFNFKIVNKNSYF